MKQLILLIFSSFSFCIAKGQERTTLEYDRTHYAVNTIDSVTLNGIKLAFRTIPENDTLKVLMLLCDTSVKSFVSTDYHSIIQTKDTGWLMYDYKKDTSYYRNMQNFTVFGFKVYDYTNNEIIYLDEQKNKLPKNIIVWQDIEKLNQ